MAWEIEPCSKRYSGGRCPSRHAFRKDELLIDSHGGALALAQVLGTRYVLWSAEDELSCFALG